MQCLRCQQPVRPVVQSQQSVLPGICLQCGLPALDKQLPLPWRQNLEQPQAAMAQHVILQPRQQRAG